MVRSRKSGSGSWRVYDAVDLRQDAVVVVVAGAPARRLRAQVTSTTMAGLGASLSARMRSEANSLMGVGSLPVCDLSRDLTAARDAERRAGSVADGRFPSLCGGVLLVIRSLPAWNRTGLRVGCLPGGLGKRESV